MAIVREAATGEDEFRRGDGGTPLLLEAGKLGGGSKVLSIADRETKKPGRSAARRNVAARKCIADPGF